MSEGEVMKEVSGSFIFSDAEECKQIMKMVTIICSDIGTLSLD